MNAPSDDDAALDSCFRDAVAAIDAGDVEALRREIAANPSIVRERLEAPGAWLRDTVGQALDGFFQRPYLLWFVAEDPVRTGRLPASIASIANVIIDAARREAASSLQEQLDYALTLVSWSWIARQCGVQIALIDVLIDAGAAPGNNPDSALVNSNVAAAEHLVKRGAHLTLATALCIGRWDDVDRLVATSTDDEKRMAFVLAALNGKADALRRMIRAGVDVNAPSADLYSHGTPLHHAVSSGSLEAVQALVEGGAAVNAKDSAWDGTPLGWAQHYVDEARPEHADRQYTEIAAYLQGRS
jgi:peptide-methionine (S)-S-oxide reductase